MFFISGSVLFCAVTSLQKGGACHAPSPLTPQDGFATRIIATRGPSEQSRRPKDEKPAKKAAILTELLTPSPVSRLERADPLGHRLGYGALDSQQMNRFTQDLTNGNHAPRRVGEKEFGCALQVLVM